MDKLTSEARKLLCEGAQDEEGATCEGNNVANYLARDVCGSLFHARWCEDCSRLALQSGHKLYREVTP